MAYAKNHNAGILDSIPLGIPMLACLWVWDEFDDFQDGIRQINPDKENEESGGDNLELILCDFWFLTLFFLYLD